MNLEGKFVEANLAKQKITELKRTKELKLIKESELRQIEEKNVLEEKQYAELNDFNSIMDNHFKQLNEKFEHLQNELYQKHQKEIETFTTKFEAETQTTTPKPSKELIVLNRQMELYAKQKDYQNAHNVQVKILNKSKKEKEAFLKNRQIKLKKEIENLKQMQLLEVNALNLKLETQYNEFKKTRALELEKLFLRYKIQIRGLTNLHNQEKSNFQKILLGKPCKTPIRPLSNPPSI